MPTEVELLLLLLVLFSMFGWHRNAFPYLPAYYPPYFPVVYLSACLPVSYTCIACWWLLWEGRDYMVLPWPFSAAFTHKACCCTCSIRNLSGPCMVVGASGPLTFPVPCFSLYQSSLQVFIFTDTYAMGLPFPFIILFCLFFSILKQYRIWLVWFPPNKSETKTYKAACVLKV